MSLARFLWERVKFHSVMYIGSEPNPADDVLNHYSNLFIASNVNSCLNLRDHPSMKGEVIGRIEKNGKREEIFPTLIGTEAAQDACARLK